MPLLNLLYINANLLTPALVDMWIHYQALTLNAGSDGVVVFRRIQTDHAHVLSDTQLHRSMLLQSPPHGTLAALSAEVQNSFRSQWLSEYETLEDRVKAFGDKHIAPNRRYLPQGRKLRDMVCLSELDDRRGYFQYRRQLLESSGGAVIAVAVWEIQAVRSMQGWSLAPQDLRHTYGRSLSDSPAPTASVTGESLDTKPRFDDSDLRGDRDSSQYNARFTISATVPSHSSLDYSFEER